MTQGGRTLAATGRRVLSVATVCVDAKAKLGPVCDAVHTAYDPAATVAAANTRRDQLITVLLHPPAGAGAPVG